MSLSDEFDVSPTDDVRGEQAQLQWFERLADELASADELVIALASDETRPEHGVKLQSGPMANCDPKVLHITAVQTCHGKIMLPRTGKAYRFVKETVARPGADEVDTQLDAGDS